MKTAVAAKNSMDGQIWFNGRLVEINPEYLRSEDLLSSPRLLDGFIPCPGCKDVFVLEGYCADCKRINGDLEARRSARLNAVERVDNGTVEFEELATECPASPAAVGVILFAALCSAMFMLTGLWYVGRGLVGIVLEHSTK